MIEVLALPTVILHAHKLAGDITRRRSYLATLTLLAGISSPAAAQVKPRFTDVTATTVRPVCW